jgi:hypothetical protein
MSRMQKVLFGTVLALMLVVALPVSAFASDLTEDRIIFGGVYVLDSGETLDGDLVVFGGTATLEVGSVVTGDVFIMGGNLEGSGTIQGDLVILGGNANLSESTLIQGDVSVFGGNVNRNGASIEGEFRTGDSISIPFVFDENWDFGLDQIDFPRVSFQARVSWLVFQSFVMAALALIVMAVAPTGTARVADAFARFPLQSGAFGLLTALAFVPGIVLMAVTILMIPLIPVVVLLLVAAGFFGWLAIGYELGRRMLASTESNVSPVLAAGLGTLVLSLVSGGISFIPCWGGLFGLIVGLVGLGAVIITRFGTKVYAPELGTSLSTSEELPSPADKPEAEGETPAEDEAES